MQKMIAAAAAAALMVSGCAGTKAIKVTEHEYVPYGAFETYTPKTVLGGYRLRVTVGKDVTASVLTNEVQAAAFTGDAILLLEMRRQP